ncbi:MAG: VRR-NUC domain-containing protein [Nitrospirota bacterium]|nr:VRR-NUC domain-containing protein [Nitrospirota bacterium]
MTSVLGLPLTEEQEQRLLLEWAHLVRGKFPALRLLFHVPNGGLRHPVTAARLKLLGVKPGVPDLILPVPKNGFMGLFIEMKRSVDRPKKKDAKGQLSDAQLWWRHELVCQGYRVEVCYGFEAAKEVLEEYLG